MASNDPEGIVKEKMHKITELTMEGNPKTTGWNPVQLGSTELFLTSFGWMVSVGVP